jgi:hypothetical protein
VQYLIRIADSGIALLLMEEDNDGLAAVYLDPIS